MQAVPKDTIVPLVIGLVRAIRECCQRQEMEMCRELTLTPSQLACLMAVPAQAEEFNVHQVAEVMGLSPSRASRIVDSLACDGLLYRRTADNDRRIQVLALTPAGNKKWHTACDLLAERKEAAIQLPPEGCRELAEKLRCWSTHGNLGPAGVNVPKASGAHCLAL